MAKGLRETIHNYLLASAIFLSPIVFPLKANAEILEKKVISSGKEYSMTIDTDREEYNLQPDIGEAEARNALASYILDDFANNIKSKIKKVDGETEKFLWQNPSEMQLGFSEFSFSQPYLTALEKNVLEFQPYNIPEMNFNAWKKGNEISLKFGLPSQDYALEWYKNCGIAVLYSKDAKIVGRGPDEVQVLGDKEGSFGMRNIEKDNFSEEREAYGMLADAIIERGFQEGGKNHLGMVFSQLYHFPNMLAKDVKTKREEIIEYLKSRYKCLPYSPAYFYAIPEQERAVPVRFDKNPEELYFFVNSDVSLRKKEYGTQTKTGGGLCRIIEVNTKEVTNETIVGKIINHGRLINKTLDDFLSEYENKKQLKKFGFKEKARLYENLGNWNAQIQPFLNMLTKLQDKEIQGSIIDLPEHQRFQQEAKAIQDSLKSLDKLVDEYFFTGNYLPYLFSPRRTFDSYKKAMLEKNWKMRDKTLFRNGEILFLWEKWLQDKKSLSSYTRNEIAETESLIPSWRFIKEMPYTSDMYKEFVNKNTVEAGAFVYKGYCNILFVRTNDGWKLDRSGESEAGLVRVVCSILNEIGKNKEIQKKIISDGISYNFLEPSIFPCHYSNFSKLSMARYGEKKERLEIKGAIECYACGLNFKIKNTTSEIIIYHFGPDHKDDGGLIIYNPETGKGDIGISFDK